MGVWGCGNWGNGCGEMNYIWILERNDTNRTWEILESCVVVAPDAESANAICVKEGKSNGPDWPADLAKVDIRNIGVAHADVEVGIAHMSYLGV